MLQNKQITFIGAGVMAEAMFAGLLKKNLLRPEQITATDVRPERLAQLNELYGIRTNPHNAKAVAKADIVVLAIKPQYLHTAGPGLRGHLPANSVLISILAGTSIKTLMDSLGHACVVRAMPNTPAQIGHAMTVWTASAAVSQEQKAEAQAVLGAFGQEEVVDKESFLDMATAINGSGPGYVFLILEAMVDAGVQMGFPRPLAQELVMQTVLGSVMYAMSSDKHLAELRNEVTSPGGTTAAGLFALENAGLRTTLAKGILAAYERSIALGKGEQ